MNCHTYVLKWSVEYGIGIGDIRFGGYTRKLPDDIGGRCYYFLFDGERNATIYIPERIIGKHCLCKVALWHEFCHAELFIKTGRMGHSWRWFLKTLRKPHMFLGQLFLMLIW